MCDRGWGMRVQKRIKEAGVESRVVIKYIVVDLAFFDNHPLLRWLVSRVVQTGARAPSCPCTLGCPAGLCLFLCC